MLEGLRRVLKAKAWRHKKEWQADCVATDLVVLVKPMTYVNRTGEAVLAITNHYKAAPSDFLFVCDDVNLMFPKLRLRESGSAGGHHGLESVIESFGHGDFARLRIGVGNESMPTDDLTKFVLEHFSRQEEGQINLILDNVISICKTWVEEGFQTAMTRVSQLQSNLEREE